MHWILRWLWLKLTDRRPKITIYLCPDCNEPLQPLTEETEAT